MTTNQGRLLCLDEEPAIGRTIGLVAEGIGFEARAVSRPGPFLRELDIWAPTHIELDLIMPEMDGVEVVRLLAGRQCRAAVIIPRGVGGRGLDAAQRSAGEHGMDVCGVMGKPVFPDAVRQLLTTTTERSLAVS